MDETPSTEAPPAGGPSASSSSNNRNPTPTALSSATVAHTDATSVVRPEFAIPRSDSGVEHHPSKRRKLDDASFSPPTTRVDDDSTLPSSLGMPTSHDDQLFSSLGMDEHFRLDPIVSEAAVEPDGYADLLAQKEDEERREREQDQEQTSLAMAALQAQVEGAGNGPVDLNLDELDHAQLELFVAQFAESQRQAAQLEEQNNLDTSHDTGRTEENVTEAAGQEGPEDQSSPAVPKEESLADGGEVDEQGMAVDSGELTSAPPEAAAEGVERAGDVRPRDDGRGTDEAGKHKEGSRSGVLTVGEAEDKPSTRTAELAEASSGSATTTSPERSQTSRTAPSPVTLAEPSTPPIQASSVAVPLPDIDLQNATPSELQSAAAHALSALNENAQQAVLAALQQITGMLPPGSAPSQLDLSQLGIVLPPGLNGSREQGRDGPAAVESRPMIGGSSAVAGGKSAQEIQAAAQKASAASAEAAKGLQPDARAGSNQVDAALALGVRPPSVLGQMVPPLQAQPMASTSTNPSTHAVPPPTPPFPYRATSLPNNGGPLSPAANRGNTPTFVPHSPNGPSLKGKSRANTPEDDDDTDDEASTPRPRGSSADAPDGETVVERRERKKRNRLTLSCTECHRRKQQCDRNIPCGRCIKRGVPGLCHMEIPVTIPRKAGKRKREDELSSAGEGSTSDAFSPYAREGVYKHPQQEAGLAISRPTGDPRRPSLPTALHRPVPAAHVPTPTAKPRVEAAAGTVGANSYTSSDLDDDGAANISAGLAALVQATAAAEQAAAAAEEAALAGQVEDAGGQNGEAAALLAQIAQSLQKVQPAEAQVQEAAGDAQGGLLMNVLTQLTGSSSKTQPASLLNGLLASAAPTPMLPGVWAEIPSALPETSVQVSLAFSSDMGEKKFNLGLVGFREDDGRIFVPPTTRQIERSFYMRGGLTHEALPIEGYGPFLEFGLRFSYGRESPAYKQGRIAAVQAMSLTGALRLGATFLSRHPSHPPLKAIYIPTPTVEEDAWALKDAGLEIRLYRFYDKKTGLVDWEGMKEDLTEAPDASIILLHISGSSPTGAEMTPQQWRMFTELVKSKKHIVFAVMEFQGLASGDPDKDAQPLRLLAYENIPLVLAQNFDSSMGLYSDSPTIVSVVANSQDAKYRIESQLRSMARALHGHPPPWGANVCAGILGNPEVYKNWLSEVKAMAERLRSIREKLYDQLANKLKTPGNWTHIRRSAGMFSSALLTQEQLEILANREHVHLLPDGCFSLGCLNASKIEAFANAIDNVVRYPEGVPEPEPEPEIEIVDVDMESDTEAGQQAASEMEQAALEIERALQEQILAAATAVA